MWFNHIWYRFGLAPSAGTQGSLRSYWGFWGGGFAAPSSTPPVTPTAGSWLVLARRRFRR